MLFVDIDRVSVLDELQLAWGLLLALFCIHEWITSFLLKHS